MATSRSPPLDAVARVLGCRPYLGGLPPPFVLFTSDPFTRTPPYFPVDGRDQPAAAGSLVSFSTRRCSGYGLCGFLGGVCLAIASLMTGRLDATWAALVRP